MNNTGKRIIQKTLAIVIVLIMTMADLCFVGSSIISYAEDIAEVNNQNVKFKAYFLDGNESTNITSTIDKNDLKIAIELGVIKDGYISPNAKVELSEDANFKFKTDVYDAEKISSIDERSITFKNQINDEQTIKVEIGIEFKYKEEFDLLYLNKESKLNLSGVYSNSKNSNLEIKGTTNLTINWVSSETNAVLNAELINNSLHEEEGTNKRIVQLLIKSKIENNSYPVKSTNIELNIPGNPENVTVHKRSTSATNGDKEFNTDNYTFSDIDGKLSINIQNGQDDKIAWQKNAEDVLVVTAKYPETAELTNSSITTNYTITTYDGKELKPTDSITTAIANNVEKVVSIAEKETINEMSKGKIYTGKNVDYKTNTEVYIDYADFIQTLEITENEVKAIKGEEEKDLAVNYKEIKLNRANIVSILGDTWTINIKDPNNSNNNVTLNESTPDENGDIIVTCAEGVNKLNIELSRPANNGTFKYEVTKTIKNTNYGINEIKEFAKIKDSNQVKYTKTEGENTSKASATINLTNTKTKASIEVEPLTLTTSSEQELNMNVTLESSSENRDLFKNPTIEIELPEQINSIGSEEEQVTCMLLYGENDLRIANNGFEIVEKDNHFVINIKIEGEQKEYRENSPTIMITAPKIGLNRYATNSAEKIKMKYTNANVTAYEKEMNGKGYEEVGINIVSENSMILTNDIKELNISTFGKEEDKEVPLESNVAAKNAKINMHVTNNEESDITGVKIIGKIPYIDGKIERTSAVGTKTNSGAKVYYTSIDNPTSNETLAENKWALAQPQKDSKYFLILLNTIGKGETFNFSYDIKIGENLPYNLTTESLYSVEYTNKLTNTQKRVESTKLVFTTGKVAELKQTISAKVQGKEIKPGDEVKAGEIIEYTAVISNTGRQSANNVTVTANIPNNTTLLEVNPKYPGFDESKDVYTYTEEYFIEKADKQLVKSNLSVSENKEAIFNILVRVNEKLTETVNEKLDISVVDANGNTINGEFANKFTPAQVSVIVKPIAREANTELEYGFACNYLAEIKNLTDKELKNVKVTVNNNELVAINSMKYHSGETTEDVGGNTFEIKSILPNDSAQIKIEASTTNKISNSDMATMSLNVNDSNGNTYKSNIISEKLVAERVDIQVKAESESNDSNKNVKQNEIITYTARIKNTGKKDVNNLKIEARLSDYLDLQSVKVNGKDYKQYEIDADTGAEAEYSLIKISGIALEVGEEATIQIKGKVSNNLPEDKDSLKINNKFIVYEDSLLLSESNENEFIIKSESKNSGENGNSGNQEINNNESNLYSISGTVWNDANNNGARDSEETFIEGVKVYAINSDTNKIVTYNNEEITATTGNNGTYTLTNLTKGNYIVLFEYDTEKYMVTTYQAEGVDNTMNSDAVKASKIVNEEEKLAAYTDSIDLANNESNIDLGLAEAKIFKLSLEKKISKIIVTNKNGTKTYNFDDTNLAKVEIAAKDLSESNVVIEYKLKVTNTGEVAGYAKSIVDYIPSSLTFNSGLNNDWYKKGDSLYNTSLSDTLIEPGESKEVTLLLTKKMTESNTGLTNNKAAIETSYNSLGIENTDPTSVEAMNKETTQNSKTSASSSSAQMPNSADTIIGVQTGSAVSYVALTLTVIIAICGLAYLVNKKLLLEKIEI